MLLNVKHHDGTTELRHIIIGQKVVGTRFTSAVIETRQEAIALLTPEGQKWFANNLVPGFSASSHND